jgi:GT2 family glycosyltransferase
MMRWISFFQNQARRYLPLPIKQRVKRYFPAYQTSLLSQIPISSDYVSVEDALRVWDKPPLRQALGRGTHPYQWASHVSIIVLTQNKLPYTRQCLESLYRNTDCSHFELLVVDNASTDGTHAYLDGLKQRLPNLHAVFNDYNKGFARANNRGIMQSRGEYIVLLNNDTIVTPGWLPRLIEYLERDPKIGMVGPVTNSAGNEQMIPASYQSLEELEAFARQRSITHKGQSFEIEMLAMFCVIFRRRLLDEVGLLDEHFELGTFEDDDFCHRVKSLGYKLICAEDVFVHHFGKATMGELGDQGYLELFERNRKKFEQKWGVRWRPHRLRL